MSERAIDHPLYQTWRGINRRCTDPKTNHWKAYGERGITVDARWQCTGRGKDVSGFWRFVADMGPRPGENYTVDRIDNDGPYSPENCRWASPGQQALNRGQGYPLMLRVTGVRFVHGRANERAASTLYAVADRVAERLREAPTTT